jgi:4-hydroxy-tetrahydrodipicolinate synthase
LAVANSHYKNVSAVKEATGNIENMRLTRKVCGEDFDILSGDDDKTVAMILDEHIKATGVISVMSNVAPKAIQEMVSSLLSGKVEAGKRIAEALKPLFQIVTVKTSEETQYGPVVCKARNPLPCKTLMAILGMPSGPCRRPLGKMTKKGLEVVLNAVRSVYEKNPHILTPIEEFFDVSLDERLNKEEQWQRLTYE